MAWSASWLGRFPKVHLKSIYRLSRSAGSAPGPRSTEMGTLSHAPGSSQSEDPIYEFLVSIPLISLEPDAGDALMNVMG